MEHYGREQTENRGFDGVGWIEDIDEVEVDNGG